jgi:hypothetical protein
MLRSPIRTGLRATIAPFLIVGAIGSALAIGHSAISAPVNENRCVNGGSHVHAIATNQPVAAQIAVNTCSHPCDGLYQSRRELCDKLSDSKYAPCMSKAADYYADCLSAHQA